MLRSMFAGVSGLRSHQTFMDVIGNNIANVNTTGYKASQMVFSDLLSQVVQSASAGSGSTAGTNPAAIGLGVTVGAIRGSFTQGASQLTGRSTDLAIQGDGFFDVKKGGADYYTRAGSFTFDAVGRLTTPDGSIVQGWLRDASGNIDINQPPADLTFPVGQLQEPDGTKAIRLGGNLPADAVVTPTPTTVTSAISAYDVLGREFVMNYTFTKTANPNEWSVQLSGHAAGPTPSSNIGGPHLVTFDATSGAIASVDGVAGAGSYSITQAQLQAALSGSQWPAAGVTMDMGKGAADGLTQFAGATNAGAQSQDGFALGFLRSFAIDKDGLVTGVFSNGNNKSLGQLALASFSNPAGLEKVGDSLFRTTVNSGNAQLGRAGENGRGSLNAGTLEMSNVELAQEFTNLVIAQRGFQANSRVVTASDQLLQDLVQMAR